MRSAPTFFLLSLATLSCASPLADASQEAQLSKFMASRIAPLPGRCKTPPSGSKEADRIEALPGQPPRVDFEQYAGYVTVGEEHGRELFYYFVESPRDAASKPLILWRDGGPGCSSLGYGAMMELGPFRVNPDGETLRRNQYAWNNLANVIFLESPAGVGFSVSRDAADCKTVHDGRIAEDTYTFLVGWLERFPEYKGREFFVAGESYGGHYVPQVATVIALMNRRLPGHQAPINLRGIFVGNPLLDNDLFNKGHLEFPWSHGVISDEVWADILSDGSFDVPGDMKCSLDDHKFRGAEIDCFNIYAPVCLRSRNGTNYSSSNLPGYDPCSEHYIKSYLNNLEVQKALHARIGNWSACIQNMTRIDSPAFMVPTIRYLVDIGLRVWIYSGDFDSICSLTMTRYSVKDLNLAVTRKWRPWYTPNGEVGGYVQQYQGGFTLASVRAAGHMVPASQPERSLVLLHAFLKNMLPPANIPD
ncbi:serine carboxypeptidase II-3-like [Panicum miliaceum]|uniref:Carboxypeptidase n=1 Tax=Panicum miliaceum TaxID=4540 RepID=A0A3L6TE39_PANMI|nr:serine carboxypeptidase II-3-like [Panicum miliaceum]